ncbi:MAG: RES family NAD+ phosphorylase [Acidobacteria bacterium]|nr:RES family NAD+ phosphorylase [Acidobacteriota bacterium]
MPKATDTVIYRLHSSHYAATDTTGAFLQGGRWHTQGKHVLYAAEHISLAVLETLVHTTGLPLPPKSVARVTIPAEVLIEHAIWQ